MADRGRSMKRVGGALRSGSSGRDSSAESRRARDDQRRLEEAVAQSLHDTAAVGAFTMSTVALAAEAEERFPHMTMQHIAEIYPGMSSRDRRQAVREARAITDAARREFMDARLAAISTAGPGHHGDDGPYGDDGPHGDDGPYGDDGPHGDDGPAEELDVADTVAMEHLRDELVAEAEYRRIIPVGTDLPLAQTPSLIAEQDELLALQTPPSGVAWKCNSLRHVSTVGDHLPLTLELQTAMRDTHALHGAARTAARAAVLAQMGHQTRMALVHTRASILTHEGLDLRVPGAITHAVVMSSQSPAHRVRSENVRRELEERLRAIWADPDEVTDQLSAILATRIVTFATILPPAFHTQHYDALRDLAELTPAEMTGVRNVANHVLGMFPRPPVPPATTLTADDIYSHFHRISTNGGALFEYGGLYIPGDFNTEDVDVVMLGAATANLLRGEEAILAIMNDHYHDTGEGVELGPSDFATSAALTFTAIRALFQGDLMMRMVKHMLHEEGGSIKICPEILVRLVKAGTGPAFVGEAVVVGLTWTFQESDDDLVLRDKISEMIAALVALVFDRNSKKSGMEIQSISSIRFSGAKISRLTRGGTYFELPKALASRTAVQNIYSDDNLCAQYAVALAIYMLDHATKPPGGDLSSCSAYKFIIKGLKWTDITFPMEPQQWSRFERLNPKYGVFLYEWDADRERVIANRIPSNREKCTHFLKLLLVSSKDKEGNDIWHYVTITSMARLFSSRTMRVANGGLICPICINNVKQDDFDDHFRMCKEVCDTAMVYPQPGTTIQYDKFLCENYSIFNIMADTECIVEKVLDTEERVFELQSSDAAVSGSICTSEHKPVAFGVHVMNMMPMSISNDIVESLCPTRLLVGGEPTKLTEQFIDLVVGYGETLRELAAPKPSNRHPMYMINLATDFALAPDEKCCVCGYSIRGVSKLPWAHKDPENIIGNIVNLVNHYTGEYKGHCHAFCSKKVYSDIAKPKIVVWFHNGSGYDLKIIVSNLGATKWADQLKNTYILAKSSERWTRFDLAGIQFKDTMSHLPQSLSNLVDRIARNETEVDNNCTILKTVICKHYAHIAGIDIKWKLLARKGVFPYKYLDSYSKLVSVGLPSKDDFHSDLGVGSDISTADYDFACEVFSIFQCQTLQDYMELYLLTDICLLGDVWFQYRRFVMQHYNLDPARFESLPAVAFASALRLSNTKVELISDPDMAMFIQRSVRGGVSYAVRPHAVANNSETRRLGGDTSGIKHDTDTHILYFDANSLYGGCMREFLPTGNFEWVDKSNWTVEIVTEKILPIVRDNLSSNFNFFIEVDLSYPKQLHDLFNDLPPAPDAAVTNKDHLSHQQRTSNGEDASYGMKKLLPSLLSKKRYVAYGTTLALWVDCGVVIDKVHRVLQFDQSPWMRPFIDTNIRLRKEARSNGDEFGVDMAKLMGNSAYGKTIQDPRRETSLTLMHTDKSDDEAKRDHIQRQIGKNNWKRGVSIGHGLWVIEKAKRQVTMDKPSHVGAVILEISKYVMYRFWYMVLKKHFGDRISLLYMDTDSFMMQVTSRDAYAELALIERTANGGTPVSTPGDGFFDWSSMDRRIDFDQPEYGSQVNQLVQYKFKNELGSKGVIVEAIFVRSKLYQFKMMDRATGKEIVKCLAKGVPKPCRTSLNYNLCLVSKGSQSCVATLIRSFHMKVTTGLYRKKALPESVLSNDKRYLFSENLDSTSPVYISYAIGHWRTTTLE